MKKSNNLIIVLSTALIVIGVILGCFTTKYSNEISAAITTITAIIGAVALWFQFKKDHDTNQASFIIEFYKTFNDNEDNMKVLEVLDNKFDGFTENISLVGYRKEIQSYLNWIKTLCDLIEENIITIKSIDRLFSYEFFSICDNKEIQDMELRKYPWLYKSLFVVHKKWSDYRKKHGLTNDVYNNESLSLVPEYEQYSK